MFQWAMSATRRHSYDRDASREAVISAAMRLFAQRGFAATRVEDIADAAGYTRGAFYFHFENKLECFWAVIAYREQLRGDWVAEATAGLDDASTSLEAALVRLFALFARTDQGVDAWVLVMVDFFQQHRHDESVRAKLAPVYAGWHANVARYVRALQAAGLADRVKDPDLLAAQAFAYVEGLTTHARLYSLASQTLQMALVDGLATLLRPHAAGHDERRR
jgi:AcrR family transcriptional regulator